MSTTRSASHLGRLAGLATALLLLLAFMTFGPTGAEAQSRRSSGSFFTIAEKHSEVAVEQTLYGDAIDVSAYRELVVNLGIEAANLDSGQYVKLGIQTCNHTEADDWDDLVALTFTQGSSNAPLSSFALISVDEEKPLARYVRWSLEFQTATTSQSVVLRASAVGHQ